MKPALALVFVAVLWTPAGAQVIADPDAEQFDVGAYTCEEHVELVEEDDGRADVRNMWAHGFRSALLKVDVSHRPFTWQDLVAFAQELEKICLDNRRIKWLDAVKNVKSVTRP